jgi:predicted ATP-binding protein involved in virulence
MRALELDLQNIGPFDEAHLTFLSYPAEAPPVTFITGENGAGKSILLDAIRGMFGEQFCKLERAIWRPNTPFRIDLSLHFDSQKKTLSSSNRGGQNNFRPNDSTLVNVPVDLAHGGGTCPNWIVDFWRSTLATDVYEIDKLGSQNHRAYLRGSLQGTHRNAAVTELICYFDYLRSSDEPRERQAGELLFETTKKIIKASLLDGALSHVARSTFTPLVTQSGRTVPLANLSSGNAYLIQRMIALLGKMYAVHVLRGTDPAELCNTPGLLLIDEAENHLHPVWQKRLIRGILDVFPNLQIIATTHSPFIVSSVPDARVFVCRFNGETCVVSEESDGYASKPVDEVLLSGAFDETQPFNEEISALIAKRKQAVESGDVVSRRRIEAILKEKNPDYFSYLDVEERLKAIGGAR